MKIIVFAHLDPQSMFDEGRWAGLSYKAADFFSDFEEVKLELEVEEETGLVLSAKVVE